MNHDDKPILITGSTGFIGSYLAMQLLEAGEQVVLFDRDPDMRRLTGFNERFNAGRDQLTFGQVRRLPTSPTKWRSSPIASRPSSSINRSKGAWEALFRRRAPVTER